MSSTDVARIRAKLADAAETNIDDTNMGVNNVYENPEGRKPGTLDARWGDTPPGNLVANSTAVRREAEDARANMLERLFDGLRASASAEQALVRDAYPNAAEGEPHSPLLQRGQHKTAATLTDQVLRICGRR